MWGIVSASPRTAYLGKWGQIEWGTSPSFGAGAPLTATQLRQVWVPAWEKTSSKVRNFEKTEGYAINSRERRVLGVCYRNETLAERCKNDPPFPAFSKLTFLRQWKLQSLWNAYCMQFSVTTDALFFAILLIMANWINAVFVNVDFVSQKILGSVVKEKVTFTQDNKASKFYFFSIRQGWSFPFFSLASKAQPQKKVSSVQHNRKSSRDEPSSYGNYLVGPSSSLKRNKRRERKNYWNLPFFLASSSKEGLLVVCTLRRYGRSWNSQPDSRCHRSDVRHDIPLYAGAKYKWRINMAFSQICRRQQPVFEGVTCSLQRLVSGRSFYSSYTLHRHVQNEPVCLGKT